MVSIEPRVERFLQLVQAEYREMPGLQLTKPQMRRFLGVDAMTCELVVERLEREHFLRRTLRDSYVLQS
ncbi:MAG TPA: hypothetical protein VN628_08450 [Vicinamibacterales bacterium]|nr:hypothetical protein [Vicinamibacterales bacterium]